MDDPSRKLAEAREHLEALKQAGLSRETLLALLDEDSQQPQHSQPQPLPQQQQLDLRRMWNIPPRPSRPYRPIDVAMYGTGNH